jgi:hypothetical protein
MQLRYSDSPAIGLPGGKVDAGRDDNVKSFIADCDANGIPPGVFVVRGDGDDDAKLPSVPTADPDAIIATIGSTTGIQSLSGASLDGVIGGGRISPPRQISLVLSSHANWDATNATLSGEDENGVAITETLAIPDGGNTTVTSTKYFSRVTSLGIPAQAGTSGTATLGTAAGFTIDTNEVLGIVVRETSREPGNYVDADPLPVATKGRFFATVEDAHESGDPVYVRFVAGVGEQLGAVRSSPDSTDCVRFTRAAIRSSGAAGALAAIEINTP